jgi:predicted DNA-binding protein with PD1-like motif
MRAKVIHDGAEGISGEQRTFALIFDTDDEVIAGLTGFAKERSLTAAHFTAIGAFRAAILGFFDWEQKRYKKIPVQEQVEVLSLVGDIALKDGQPTVHAHVVVGKGDGTAHGGHLMEAYVRPTLEVILVESPNFLQRQHDPASGLALIDVGASGGMEAAAQRPLGA